MSWHCRARGHWVLGGWGGSLGIYLGGRGGDGGGTTVDIRASSKTPGMELRKKRGVWEEDLLSAEGVMVSQMDGGGEGGGVNIGGWGEANSLGHLSALESHSADGGWSPNCNSSDRSPQPRFSPQKEGIEGTEEPR